MNNKQQDLAGPGISTYEEVATDPKVIEAYLGTGAASADAAA